MKSAKTSILHGIKLYWQKKWNQSQDGNHLKLFQPIVNLRPCYLFISNRREQLNLHHLRLGRSNLNGQDPANKTSLPEKLCEECMEIEDTHHFILKCSRFSAQRRLLFLNIETVYDTYNIPPNHRIFNELILGDNPGITKKASLEIMQHVINYIDATKRLK